MGYAIKEREIGMTHADDDGAAGATLSAAQGTPLPARPGDIPEDLKAHARWVVWEAVWQEERGCPGDGWWAQLAYDARTGERATAGEPKTWRGFEEAARAYEDGAHGRRWSGLGFVLTDDDPFCVVEFEEGLTPDGAVTPDAARFLGLLGSYAERTPEGRGVRAWMRGCLPPGARRRGDLEMSECDRILAVTGERIPGTPARIAARQGALEEAHLEAFPPPRRPASMTVPVGAAAGAPDDDGELLAVAFRGPTGAKIRALYRGDAAAVPGDRSGADLALCSLLGFYTGNDPRRLDRLFRTSALYRPRWDTPLYSDGSTYGQAMLAKALEGCVAFYHYPPAADTVRLATPVPMESLLAAGVRAAGGALASITVGGHTVTAMAASGASATVTAPTAATAAPVPAESGEARTPALPAPASPARPDADPIRVAAIQGRAQGLAMTEKVLTADEAAALLHISPRLLRRCYAPWRRFGTRPSGDRWLQSQLLGGTATGGNLPAAAL